MLYVHVQGSLELRLGSADQQLWVSRFRLRRLNSNSPFWQVLPSPLSSMSAGHEHLTFQWPNEEHTWLQPPLFIVQESEKENITNKLPFDPFIKKSLINLTCKFSTGYEI